LFLPTFQQDFPNNAPKAPLIGSTLGQTFTFRFIGFYSDFSLALNFLMQSLAFICLMGAVETALGPSSCFSQKQKRTHSFIQKGAKTLAVVGNCL
jgi:hypothetical protein